MDWKKGLRVKDLVGVLPPGMKPRKDFVLFLRVIKGETKTGIAVGQNALEGIFHVVVACGDGEGAKDLKPGDTVMIMGKIKEDYAPVPGFTDLFITKEVNVLLNLGCWEDRPEATGKEVA